MSLLIQPDSIVAPARSLAVVVPGNSDLPYLCKALFVGGAGNIIILAADDSSPVTLAVGAGTLLPIRAKQVQTGTTASGIVALI